MKYFLLFCASAVGDIVTTQIAMKRGGVEGNPLLRGMDSGSMVGLQVVLYGATAVIAREIWAPDWLWIALSLFPLAMTANNLAVLWRG